MPAFAPLLTEGLSIRRLGIVTQATATIWRDDRDPAQANEPEGRLLPITFPDQIPLGNGWRLQHASPTTGQLVTQNWLVELFRDPIYKNSLCLHSFDLRNTGLLDSIAAVFDGLRLTDERAEGRYGYSFPVLPPRPMAGGTPDFRYYRPLEAPEEQYLLLLDTRYAPGERPNEVPSLVNLYALVQVELDEQRFLFLLRQALDAASEARRYR
jgi:hypothetical protein